MYDYLYTWYSNLGCCTKIQYFTKSFFLMGYRRRYARRSYGKRAKYSMENRLLSLTPADLGEELVDSRVRYQAIQTIVPATTVQGMRKVKHITIQLSHATLQMFFAVVYVPNAVNVNYMGLVAYPDTLYEPSQFLMGSGFLDTDAGQNRIRIPTARNLNEGDSIVLLIGQSSLSASAQGMATYAITYQ